jgi:hypothetical protein
MKTLMTKLKENTIIEVELDKLLARIMSNYYEHKDPTDIREFIKNYVDSNHFNLDKFKEVISCTDEPGEMFYDHIPFIFYINKEIGEEMITRLLLELSLNHYSINHEELKTTLNFIKNDPNVSTSLKLLLKKLISKKEA